MKRPSTEQVRQAIRTLEASRDAPCDCHATVHESECEAGRICLAAVIEALNWVLGRKNDFAGALAGLRRIQAGQEP